MGLKNCSFFGINNLYFPVTVITGVCRSGKTLLGNLLATCSNVEYADEPYTAMMLPMVAYTEKLDLEFAKGWLASYLAELFNDLILLRRANFRPEDLSSIWTKKPPVEIFERLTRINTRDEAARYAKENGSKLIVILSECMPFVGFILEAIPGVKIVHVVREGHAVARDVERKKWFSDGQLLNPKMAQLYRPYSYSGATWYLPWWVDHGEEDYFLSLSDYERGLYYWCSLMAKGLMALRECVGNEILVRFEDLVASPQQEFNRIIESLGLVPGSLSNMKISEIRPISRHVTLLPANDLELQKRVQEILHKVGYPKDAK